jgi:HEAT repeat protein
MSGVLFVLSLLTMPQVVHDLADEKFTVRESAFRKLDALGVVALPALHHAAKSGDPEVSVRAQRLIERVRARWRARYYRAYALWIVYAAGVEELRGRRMISLLNEPKELFEAIADVGRERGWAPIVEITPDQEYDPLRNRWKALQMDFIRRLRRHALGLRETIGW